MAKIIRKERSSSFPAPCSPLAVKSCSSWWNNSYSSSVLQMYYNLYFSVFPHLLSNVGRPRTTFLLAWLHPVVVVVVRPILIPTTVAHCILHRAGGFRRRRASTHHAPARKHIRTSV